MGQHICEPARLTVQQVDQKCTKCAVRLGLFISTKCTFGHHVIQSMWMADIVATELTSLINN